MLILLAGLQSIPKDLYEAAEMDGTSDQRVFGELHYHYLCQCF